MKTRTVIVWILVLILLDQTIKIIINTYFVTSHFEIINSLVDFKPVFNDKHSYVNVLLYKHLGINVGLWPHIILFVVMGVIISGYFNYFRNTIQTDTKLFDTSIIFLAALFICALIGNLIWEKGTLDYIYLKPLFVFDLKDVYGDIGILLFLIYAVKNLEKLKPIKTRDVFIYQKNRLLKAKN